MGAINEMLPFILTGAVCGGAVCLLHYFLFLAYWKRYITQSKDKLMQDIKKDIPVILQNIVKTSIARHTLEEIKKDIIQHFDHFMQHKLTVALPVLNMFIDEKLIAELKTVFEKEMNEIVPAVLQKQIDKNVSDQHDISALVVDFAEAFFERAKTIFVQNLTNKFITLFFLSVLTGIVVCLIISLFFRM
ncbi:MAG: hypothetical protein H7X71_02460 [Chitinophagales bacterium]|nr:hypothetical protein [Chitinophagales bacterium]